MSYIAKLGAALWTVTIVAAGAAGLDTANAAERNRQTAWTALSISSDGVWGVALGATEAGARWAAVAACKAKLVGPDDCAARVSTSEGGLNQAYACGDRHFAISGVNRHGVEIVAAYEEAEIKIASPFDVPACRLLLTVLPGGMIEPSAGM